jgi:hypothetical protein
VVVQLVAVVWRDALSLEWGGRSWRLDLSPTRVPPASSSTPAVGAEGDEEDHNLLK